MARCEKSRFASHVTDEKLDEILKYNSAGAYEGLLGSAGSGPGQFSYQIGIVIDAAGDIFVAGTGNARVQELNPAGQFVRQWTSPDMLSPNYLTFTSNGDLLVTSDPGQVLRIHVPAQSVQPPPPPPPVSKHPRLRLTLKSRNAKVHAGKRTRFTAIVKNTGSGSAAKVKVCAQVPKKARRKVKMTACKTIRVLAAGHSARVTISAEAASKARRRYTITFTAVCAHATTARATARLTVIRPTRARRGHHRAKRHVGRA